MEKTDEADIAGLYEILSNIVKFGGKLAGITNKGDYTPSDVSTQLKVLVDKYNGARLLFKRIKGNIIITMEFIGLPSSPTESDIREVLLKLYFECKKIMAVLEKLSHPSISEKEITELESLRGELKNISTKIDMNIEKNVEMAIIEYEEGHYLPSALLSSRVIASELDKVKGGDINEKITELENSGKIKKSRKDTITKLIKASKQSRNFFSHNPNIFAESDEALSLLSDSITIIKLLNK